MERPITTTTPALVATVVQGIVVIPIPMLDELVHTDEHPYCADSTYPCQEERERQRARLPLNGNRPFSFLR
jgi:hypothetical protein